MLFTWTELQTCLCLDNKKPLLFAKQFKLFPFHSLLSVCMLRQVWGILSILLMPPAKIPWKIFLEVVPFIHSDSTKLALEGSTQHELVGFYKNRIPRDWSPKKTVISVRVMIIISKCLATIFIDIKCFYSCFIHFCICKHG